MLLDVDRRIMFEHLGNTSFDSVLSSNGFNCTNADDSRRYTIYRKTSQDPEDENETSPSPPLRNVRRTKSLGTNVPIPSQNEYSALIRRACSNERLKRFIPTTKATNEHVSRNYRDAFKKEFQNFKENHRELIAEEFPSQTRYHETFNNIFQDKRTCFAVGRPLRKSRTSTVSSTPIEINEISAIDVHENFSPPLTSAERKSLGIEKFFPKGSDPRKVYKTENRQTTPIGFRGYKAASEGRASKYKKLFRPNRSCIDVRLFDSPDCFEGDGEYGGHIPAKRSKSTDNVFIENSGNNVRNKKHFSELIGETASVFFYNRNGHSQSVGDLDNIPSDITTDFYGTYNKQLDTTPPDKAKTKSAKNSKSRKSVDKSKSKSEEDLSGEDYKESIRKIVKKYSLPQDSPTHLSTFQNPFPSQEKTSKMQIAGDQESFHIPDSAQNGVQTDHTFSTTESNGILQTTDAGVTIEDVKNDLNKTKSIDELTTNNPESPSETQIFPHFILKTNDPKQTSSHPPPDVSTFDLLKETSVDDSDGDDIEIVPAEEIIEINRVDTDKQSTNIVETIPKVDLVLEGSIERDIVNNIIDSVAAIEESNVNNILNCNEAINDHATETFSENSAVPNGILHQQDGRLNKDGNLTVTKGNTERCPDYIVVETENEIVEKKINKRDSYGDAGRSFDVDDPVVFSDDTVNNVVATHDTVANNTDTVAIDDKDGGNNDKENTDKDFSTIDSKIHDKEKKKKKRTHKSGDKIKRSSSREILDDTGDNKKHRREKIKRSSSREVLDNGDEKSLLSDKVNRSEVHDETEEKKSRSEEKVKRSSSREVLDDTGDNKKHRRDKIKRSSSREVLDNGDEKSLPSDKANRSEVHDETGEKKSRSEEKVKRSSSREVLDDTGDNKKHRREKIKRSSSREVLDNGDEKSLPSDKANRSEVHDETGEKKSRSGEKVKRSSSREVLDDTDDKKSSSSKHHHKKKMHHRSEEKIKRSSSTEDVLDVPVDNNTQDAPRPLKKRTHRSGGDKMKRSVSEDILDKPSDAPRHIKKRSQGKDGHKVRRSTSKDTLDDDTKSETKSTKSERLPDVRGRRKSGESSKSSRSSKSVPENISEERSKRRKSGESSKSSKSSKSVLDSVTEVSISSTPTKKPPHDEKRILEKSESAPHVESSKRKKSQDSYSKQGPDSEKEKIKRSASADLLDKPELLSKEKAYGKENTKNEDKKSHRHHHKSRHKHSETDLADEKDGGDGSPRKRKHKHSKHSDKQSKDSSSRTKHSHNKSHRPKSISSLKTPLLLKIFSYLSTRELCRVSQVCHKWNNLYLSPELWHSITMTNYKGDDIDDIVEMLLQRLKSVHAYTCINMQLIRLNHSVHLTDIGLINISGQCPGLKTLEITDCVEVTGQGLGAILAHCPNMSYLDLTGCEGLVDFDFSFGQHASFHELRYLDLSECYDLTDSALNLILNCATDLEYLYLRLCDTITNVGIEGVALYCTKLKEISLNDCPNLTDASIKLIVSSCPDLRYISLAKCDITDESLRYITKYSHELRHLNLHECETITDEGIRVLSQDNPILRSLDISKCRKLTSASLLSLTNCQNLRRLNVKGCRKVDDTGLKEFASYSKVRHLNVANCKVSHDMISSMKRRMKYCKIVYSKS